MGPLDSMPVFIQAVVVAMVFAAMTVGGLYLVRLKIAPDFLREDHDVAGVTFSVVGAFYGVVLAFVIVAVWQRFERADDRAQAEGLAVSNLYFLSQGFDQPVSGAIQNSLRKYASTVVSREWEQMADNHYSRSIDNESELWRLLRSYHPRTGAADLSRQEYRPDGCAERRAASALCLLQGRPALSYLDRNLCWLCDNAGL